MKRTFLLAALWLGCGSHDAFGPNDAGALDAAGDVFMIPADATGFVLDVTPAVEQDITVAIGQKTPNVTFTANAQVAWSSDHPEIGAVAQTTATSTTFTPTGNVGGIAVVSASYFGQTVSRQVFVKLAGSQNGNCPAPQIATSIAQLNTGGGIGGVGGEGCGGAITDAATKSALASPSSDGSTQKLELRYPYDATLWPRELLAPTLMWDSTLGDADAVKIELATSSGSLSWSGTFARPSILAQTGGPFVRHPIPQDVWAIATGTAGTMIHGARDRLVVKLTVAKDGVGYGPITETWDVALDGLKGTVYYGAYGTSYSTSVWGTGGAVLAIKHGAASPTLITSSTQCQTCHSVAAYGSDMVTGSTSYPGYDSPTNTAAYYDLKTPSPPGTSFANPDLYIWGAVVPDGSLLFSNSSPELRGATSAPSAVYALPSGASTITSDTISTQLGLSSPLGGSLPEFSPDGKHLVFTFYQGGPASDATNGDGRSLAVVDFDQTTSTFSDLRTIYTPTCAGCVATVPFFTPTSDAVVFEVVTKSNGEFAGTTQMNDEDPSWANCPNLDGARAELWWIDLATKTPRRLDAIDGKNYLPTGGDHHDDDSTLQFDPSVLPIASGGYVWVAFMSRRLYGNVAVTDPWCSGTFSAPPSPPTKKLWVAAFDLNAKPGDDPSHPAFYLPGQELFAGNFRTFWVRDPCEKDGATCATGDECCGGHCVAGVCGKPSGCGGEGDVCSTSTDCCAGKQCVGGYCDVVID